MTGKEALKAAKAIREYCKSKNNECDGCVFRPKPDEAIFYGCKLNNPNHLPETWELEKKKFSQG